MIRRSFIFIVLAACLVLAAACGGDSYKQIFKDQESYNSRSFPVSKDALFTAVIRTLSSTSFMIESEDADKGVINAKRLFQDKKKPAVSVQIRVSPDESNKATVFLTAIQISKKIGSVAVEDKEFYRDFFSVLGNQVKSARASGQEGPGLGEAISGLEGEEGRGRVMEGEDAEGSI